MIDKSSSIPLYVQIQNLITEQIRSGALRPGQQVPSEIEIAAQHNVSRMTVRKALDSLVIKGILYRRKGKGTYVAEHMVAYGLSTIMSFSRTFQARGYRVETRMLSASVIPGSEEILGKLHLRNAGQVVVIRRLRLIENTPAAIHTSYLDYQTYAPILNEDLNQISLLDAIQKISKLPIAYSQDSVQADLPTREEAALLEIDVDKPVLKVEGIAYAEAGQPIRLTRAVYRGDLFRLTVINTASQPSSLNLSEDLFSL